MNAETLFDRMKREAEVFTVQRKSAHKRSGLEQVNLPRDHGSNFEVMAERAANRAQHLHEAMSRIVDRDPCGFCAVRKDAHDEFGCREWRKGG